MFSAIDKIVLASSNAGKLKEIGELLAGLNLKLVPQSEFAIQDAEETGLSFVENAIIKARHAAQISQLPAIADDSGIEVDALKGAPGIYSARYAGEAASDEDNLQLLLDNIADIGVEKPLARFQCVMVFMRFADDPTPVIAQGSWEGYLVNEARGENGFGYDPIFFVPTHDCTSAELPREIKNRLSHRGQALAELLDKLSLIMQ